MGRIKTKLVKRTSRQLVDGASDAFGKEFGGNKVSLGGTMPSKRVRNMVAGYITRIKRNTKTIISEDGNAEIAKVE